MAEVDLRINFRPHQRRVWDAKFDNRWICVVMHRRAGKSFYCCADLLEEALTTDKPDWRGYFISASYRQAAAIAFDYLVSFTKDIPGIKVNKSNLSIQFPSGARIELLGVENADSLRGRYADRIICDEAQLYPQSVWAYVLRPLLADRQGSALVCGTPAGTHNLLGWAHQQEDWFQLLLPHNKTDALPEEELREMRKQMSHEAWRQEMECSFTASLQSAYFARQMDDADEAKRITTVNYDPALDVYVACDLGYGDAMSRWYFQIDGNRVQFFLYEEDNGLSLAEMVDGWKAKPFPIQEVLLPFDAEVHDLSLGIRRVDFIRNRGVTATVVPKLSFADSIEAARMMLPRCWFDRTNCARGLEALRAHRPRFDEAAQIASKTELHDWASHGSAAFRYAAVGEKLLQNYGWNEPLTSDGRERVRW